MKYIIITFVFLSSFIALPASAVDLGTELIDSAGSKAGFKSDTTETTLSENIGVVVNMALSMMGIIFTILMIYAGYLWMTARGNDEQVDKAQKIIKASVVGLIITLGAFSITSFIVPRILASTVT